MSASSSIPVPARLLAAAIAVAGFSSAASAVVVPPDVHLSDAVFTETYYNSFSNNAGSGVADTAHPGALSKNLDGYFGSASTSGGRSPSLVVDVGTGAGGGNYYVRTSALIQYQVELTNGDYGTVVPMTISLAGSSSAAGPVSEGYGRITVTNYNTNYFLQRETDTWTPGRLDTGPFADTVTFDMVVGQSYAIEMYAVATTYQGGGHAELDPTFAFVNAADAGRYALAYSPNLMAAAVPEPAPIAMGGVGLAFLAMRWARRKPRG